MDSLLFENVHKIAVLRTGGLGDFIVILPAIQAIRNAYPEAELVLLGKPWHAYFLEQKRSPIDRVIVIPPVTGIVAEGDCYNEEEQNRFLEAMQEEQWDVAVHFQGRGLAANPFLNKLNAKLTVGLISSGAVRLDRAIPYYYYQSEVLRYLEVAALIGGKNENLSPEIAVTARDKREGDDFLQGQQIADKYVVLHCCAVDFRRMWPLDNFTSLGELLFQKGYSVIFTGSQADNNQVQHIIDDMQYPATNACGALSLGGLAGLLAKSELVVGSDTGPLHLARAVGVKTVGIYWAPNLINWGPLSRTNHRPVVSWIMECPYCGTIPNDPYPFEPMLPSCKHEFSFVKNITVNEVYETCLQLLDNEKVDLGKNTLNEFEKGIII